MSLVGYGGRQDPEALGAKLARLQSECQGSRYQKDVALPESQLSVYPAEWVLDATRDQERRRLEIASRKADEAVAERRQLRLF